MAELQRVFVDLGFGTDADIEHVADEYQGFGPFLRAITGLQREAVRAAFEQFLIGKTLGAAEQNYLEPIIDSLAKNGILEVGQLYEQPFTRYAPQGPDAIFGNQDVEIIADLLQRFRKTAIPEDAAAS